MRISDWSSDVCSSDLLGQHLAVDRRDAVEGLAGGRGHELAADEGLVAVGQAAGLGFHGFDGKGGRHRLLSSLDCLHDRAAGRGRSEEHTSELKSLMRISYAVFCLKKKNS